MLLESALKGALQVAKDKWTNGKERRMRNEDRQRADLIELQVVVQHWKDLEADAFCADKGELKRSGVWEQKEIGEALSADLRSAINSVRNISSRVRHTDVDLLSKMLILNAVPHKTGTQEVAERSLLEFFKVADQLLEQIGEAIRQIEKP